MIGPTVAAVLVAAGEEGPDELRRRAGEILSRREFVPPGETLVERVLGLAAGRGITYRLTGDILLARGFAGGTTALPFESEAALRLPRLPGTS